MSAESRIRVIFFQEGPCWVAQALECDIATSGPTIEETARRIVSMIAGTRDFTAKHHGAPFVGLDPAPGKFFIMFEKGRELTPELMAEIDDGEIEITPHILARRAEEARPS